MTDAPRKVFPVRTREKPIDWKPLLECHKRFPVIMDYLRKKELEEMEKKT